MDGARRRGWLEYGDPLAPGERGRRARLARVLAWAAEGRLAELLRNDRTRTGATGATFGLLRLSDPARLWARWRRRADDVLEDYLASGRDHFELGCLAQMLDRARAEWPSPARLAAAASRTLPHARARRVRAQALLHEGAWDTAARSLGTLLAPGASPADRLAGCLGWAHWYGQAQRPGPARHALRAAVVRAPLAPEVWRLAHALATQLNDRPTRDRLARGARVVRRLGRSREAHSAPVRDSAEPTSAAPPAGPGPGPGAGPATGRVMGPAVASAVAPAVTLAVASTVAPERRGCWAQAPDPAQSGGRGA